MTNRVVFKYRQDGITNWIELLAKSQSSISVNICVGLKSTGARSETPKYRSRLMEWLIIFYFDGNLDRF